MYIVVETSAGRMILDFSDDINGIDSVNMLTNFNAGTVMYVGRYTSIIEAEKEAY